ncbi:dihydrolipoamide acetyltransferase family protein [Streptomyces vilmorinianum]|uniref:dihydrolipoamide acetyltransferase family protein n=1 Tax=Streptomyces vilmorinianum TaxID=3051092 RepID=UPI0010FB4821|nr:dihydrolipoamide acetyltransferase family protein [Streptomyces vilmorinianum]
MAEFTMPSLGADMDEGTLSQWLVRPGDRVSRGDVVAVVETAKSAIEVECFESGTVGALLVEEGTTVPVGTPLAVIEQTPGVTAGAGPRDRAEAQDRAERPSPATSPLVRRLAEERHVDLTHVHGSGPGGRITRADVDHAGVTPDRAPPAPRPVAASHGRTGPGRVKASPLARRLASELGIELGAVAGSGREGTIRAEDVRTAARETGAAVTAAVTATTPVPASAAKRSAGAARTATARLMARSKREIPHFYLSTTVDMAAALDWMHARNRALPLSRRLVPAALALKAVALAARKVPELNGHWIDDAFVPAEEVRLGIAVSLRGGGLVAPALAHADALSVTEVMAGMKDLVARARGGRLRASETAEPSITVTNLGDQGVESVFGVVYPPQVALVGLGHIVERPVAVDGLLGVRPSLTATLSADHRAADGATGARLLTALDWLLQRPEEL